MAWALPWACPWLDGPYCWARDPICVAQPCGHILHCPRCHCVNRVAMTAAVASSLPGVWVRWGGALLEPRAAAPSGSGRASLLPCRWVLDVTQGLTKARTAGHFLQPSSHVGPAVLRQLQPEAAQRAEAPSEDGGVPPHTAPDTAVSRAPSKHTAPHPPCRSLTVSCLASFHWRQPGE